MKKTRIVFNFTNFSLPLLLIKALRLRSESTSACAKRAAEEATTCSREETTTTKKERQEQRLLFLRPRSLRRPLCLSSS